MNQGRAPDLKGWVGPEKTRTGGRVSQNPFEPFGELPTESPSFRLLFLLPHFIILIRLFLIIALIMSFARFEGRVHFSWQSRHFCSDVNRTQEGFLFGYDEMTIYSQ